MKINPPRRNSGAVASVVVLVFLSCIFLIVVARGRQVSSYKQSLALVEKKQDTAKQHWFVALSENTK